MTKTLLQLHRTLWARSFQANPSQYTIVTILVLYAGIGLTSVCTMVITDIGSGTGSAHAATAGIALGMVAYAVLAMVMPAGENQLTPRSLAPLPVLFQDVRRASAATLVLTSRGLLCVGISAIYAVACTLQLRNVDATAALLFPVGVVLACVTTLLVGDCVALVGTTLAGLQGDKAKGAMGLGGVVLVFGVLALQNYMAGGVPMGRIGAIAAWTPFGAATGWGTSLCDGHIAQAAAQLVLAVAYVIGLGVLWSWLLERQFKAPVLSGTAVKAVKSSGVHGLELGRWSARGPAAMEFTRSVRYFSRDSRLIVNLVMLPVLGLFALWQVWRGLPEMAYGVLAFFGVIGGLIASNDIGYDGPSNWLKMMAPVRPRVFLRARHWAMLTPAVIIQLVTVLTVVAVAPDRLIASCAGIVGLGMFISSATCGLLLSTFNAYPVAPPGTNPWLDRSGASGAAFLAAFIGFFAGWIPLIPGIIVIVVFMGNPVGMLGGAALAVAVAAGAYALALMICSRRVDARMPEIYAKVQRFAT
ncbi:hypothetical protein [uncultured Corynebacterium sp.]|uniref:hypothetical protein n=1 Tax=uncultured Corynebacterium sp. TaxID=159447 RepID=UPI0025E05838|nr:hypothetical protein [uncultured Corynebacterium sp.]